MESKENCAGYLERDGLKLSNLQVTKGVLLSRLQNRLGLLMGSISLFLGKYVNLVVDASDLLKDQFIVHYSVVPTAVLYYNLYTVPVGKRARLVAVDGYSNDAGNKFNGFQVYDGLYHSNVYVVAEGVTIAFTAPTDIILKEGWSVSTYCSTYATGSKTFSGAVFLEVEDAF